LILAHVKYIHVRKDVLTEKGVIDLTKFKPVMHLGDISYARVPSCAIHICSSHISIR
ncbi:hypothetical protein C8R48DRAFT_621338, partial [Suillus tomentosus]